MSLLVINRLTHDGLSYDRLTNTNYWPTNTSNRYLLNAQSLIFLLKFGNLLVLFLHLAKHLVLAPQLLDFCFSNPISLPIIVLTRHFIFLLSWEGLDRTSTSGWCFIKGSDTFVGTKALVKGLVYTSDAVTLAQDLIAIRDLDCDEEVEHEEDSQYWRKNISILPHSIFKFTWAPWISFAFFKSL